jgi:hypothetical protein
VTLALIEQSEQNGLKPEYLAGKMVRIAGKKIRRKDYLSNASPKSFGLSEALFAERMFTAILRTYYKT